MNIHLEFQLPRFYGLGDTVFESYFPKGGVSDWMTELINDTATFRTAPATPGVLKRGKKSIKKNHFL